MSSKFKFKRRKKVAGTFEINVTPMIDMFSVMITFLLATAVFSSTGQTRVEVPFLSSKPAPTQEEVDKTPLRLVTVIVENKVVKMESSLSNNSSSVQKSEFANDPRGLDDLQAKLYQLRQQDPKFDKVTVMTELDTKYENLVNVVDAMRELKAGRPPIPNAPDFKVPVGIDANALIPKIVLGNVIL